MFNRKVFRYFVVGSMMSAMVFASGCSLEDVMMEGKTPSNGTEASSEENKEDEKKEDEKKTNYYETKYSGRLQGNADNVIVYGEDGDVIAKGNADFEWLTDTLVKVTFEKKVYIVDQENVVIEMEKQIEKIEKTDKDSDNKEDKKTEKK